MNRQEKCAWSDSIICSSPFVHHSTLIFIFCQQIVFLRKTVFFSVNHNIQNVFSADPLPFFLRWRIFALSFCLQYNIHSLSFSKENSFFPPLKYDAPPLLSSPLFPIFQVLRVLPARTFPWDLAMFSLFFSAQNPPFLRLFFAVFPSPVGLKNPNFHDTIPVENLDFRRAHTW